MSSADAGPSRSPATAGTAAGARNDHPGSYSPRWVGGSPPNAPWTIRAPYAKVSADATTMSPVATGASHAPPGVARNAASASSLETKPISTGTPAIDSAASPVAAAVAGIARRRPDRSRMSRLPASLSTMPTSMNSAALNSACASVCRAAAASAAVVPTPISATSNPSWLTVEYASSAFRSCCLSATAAAYTPVVSPTSTSVYSQPGLPAKTGENRASR
ncbi:MAG TPA: hypothetical protein VKP11_03260 [Frankiaceae bacterium]|nr:hypothetical protein [Frankiaceae bacterium]